MFFGKEGFIKNLLYKSKLPVNIDEVDIKRTFLSSKEWSCKRGEFKNFIGYISFIANACICDSNNNMNLLLHDKELPQKYNVLLDMISNLLKRRVW